MITAAFNYNKQSVLSTVQLCMKCTSFYGDVSVLMQSYNYTNYTSGLISGVIFLQGYSVHNLVMKRFTLYMLVCVCKRK